MLLRVGFVIKLESPNKENAMKKMITLSASKELKPEIVITIKRVRPLTQKLHIGKIIQQYLDIMGFDCYYAYDTKSQQDDLVVKWRGVTEPLVGTCRVVYSLPTTKES